MAKRPIYLALFGVALLLVISWALGEALRQRKTTRRRKKR